MRLLRLLLALMLALGASLPACAGSQGCEPSAPVATASHHHRATPAPKAPHDSPVRHAGACIGCAAELPDAQTLAAPAPPIATDPIARREAVLAGLSPGVSARPPRPRA